MKAGKERKVVRTTTYNSGLAMGSELSNHHQEVRNHSIEKKVVEGKPLHVSPGSMCDFANHLRGKYKCTDVVPHS